MQPPLFSFSSDQWAQHTFGQAQLGDARRTWRLIRIAADWAQQGGGSLPKACLGDQAAVEAAYRFARNQAIEPQAIAHSGFAATRAVVELYPTLLEIQDSTTLSFAHSGAPDQGDQGAGQDSTRRGLWVHSSLLVDPQSQQTVGLLDMQTWIRPPQERGKRHHRKQRAYADKESFKWQRAAQAIRGRLPAELLGRLISVGDRESDVFLYLADKLAHQERFVVRACWNRTVLDREQDVCAPLWQRWPLAPVVGVMTLPVPQRAGRPARQAEVTVRAQRVGLRRPQGVGKDSPAVLEVNVVAVCEQRPVPGQEPLEWILLTTEPIDTPEQVMQVIGYYRLRWRIEEFHKAWKTGAGVEELRLQEAGHLLRLAVVLAFIAVRLLQVREAMEAGAQQCCEQVLGPGEWKVLWAVVEKRPLPSQTPSVQWAYYALARLAGWTDTKRTGRVGWLTLWRGWFKLQERMEGYYAASLVGGEKM